MSEIDSDNFIQSLYGSSPKETNAVILTLDRTDTNYFFKKLLYIFNEGVVRLFNNHVDKVYLEKLSNKEYDMMNRYFHSFGIHIHFKKCLVSQMNNVKKIVRGEKVHLSDQDLLNIKYKDIYEPTIYDIIPYKYIRSNILQDRRFTKKVNNEYYIIWFSNN